MQLGRNLISVCFVLQLCGVTSNAQTINSATLPDSLEDVFPLAIGNEWNYTYSYSLWSNETGSSSNWDGPMRFTVIGFVGTQDSSVWVIEQIRDLTNRFYLFGLLQTTSPLNDTMSFNLVERLDGQHHLYRLTSDHWSKLNSVFCFTEDFTNPEMVLRYRRVDSTGLATFNSAPIGYPFGTFNFNCTRAIGLSRLYGHSGSEGGGFSNDHTLVGYTLSSVREEASIGVSLNYRLEQNYPNPFNPTTVVSFQLPVVSDVRLVVYDILGREVATLVNERKAPGSYTVKFDGSHLASGVYLCRLTAGSFVQTKKLLLIR